MLESIQKLLFDPELLIVKIQESDPKIKADFIRSSWNPSLKCSALCTAAPEEAFPALLHMWLRIQKEHAIDPENKDKPPMALLAKLFGTSAFSDPEITEMKKDCIGALTNYLVSDLDDEQKRILEIDSLKRTEGIQIKCKSGITLIFGRTAAFYFLIDDSSLTERSVPLGIDEILFKDDMPVYIRKRPGMYIGVLAKDGLYRLLFGLAEELLEVSSGNDISIKITPENIFEISSQTYSPWDNLSRISYITMASALGEYFVWQDETQEIRTEQGSLVRREEKICGNKGVRITWKPESAVFNHDTELQYYVILEKLMELAALNPYEIHLSDQENHNTISIPGGITALFHREPFRTYDRIPITISFDGTVGYAAIMFSPSALTRKAYVNNQLMLDGGTHVDGLLNGVEKALKRILKDYSAPIPESPDDSKVQKIVKRMADDFTASLTPAIIMEDLNYIIHMKLENPRFYGSWRSALKNIEVKPIVERQVETQLYAYLKEDIKPLKRIYTWAFSEEQKR